ncbi:MAG: acyl-CoA thioesterase [Pseudobdellovibrio sp.]
MSTYQRHVHVYETDLMGIVHHSNYLRFCEEARVDWCKKRGLNLNETEKHNAAVFSLTVYETRVKHVKPAKYSDKIEIVMQSKIEGIRLIFQYQIKVKDQIVCLAETVHCNLDQNLKVKRLTNELINLVETEKWTETWL